MFWHVSLFIAKCSSEKSDGRQFYVVFCLLQSGIDKQFYKKHHLFKFTNIANAVKCLKIGISNIITLIVLKWEEPR